MNLRTRISGLLLLVCLVLVGCGQIKPTQVTSSTPTREVIVIPDASIQSISYSKAYFKPGDLVQWSIEIQSSITLPTACILKAEILHIASQVDLIQQKFELQGGKQEVALTWQPPLDAPKGYGLEISLETADGRTIASASSAFDILDNWVQQPRYGFLTDFSPDRDNSSETMDVLLRNHINGLQFYDWMYRHDQYLTSEEPYKDPLGRLLSRKTVDGLISAAHERGIAAMPYTAVYASSLEFYRQHPDWALYKVDGQPWMFGDNFLAIMDPRPDSPWTKHLLSQFTQILEKTSFDGIHLDQYGDPKVGYDAQGNSYPLDTALADMINQTHDIVKAQRPDGAVVFNAVTNWPIKTVAPSQEDFVYIEVWPPYDWWDSLRLLVSQGQKEGNGKPVVLAAYIDPAKEANVHLMDAIIFANGGGHIELGEQDDMLADAYFPRFQPVSPALAGDLQRYYEFSIRYQDILGPRTKDATRDYTARMEIPGVSIATGAIMDKILPIVRESSWGTGISLINLLGIEHGEWAVAAPEPTELKSLQLKLSGNSRRIHQAWFASPDHQELVLTPIDFVQDGDTTTFQIPGLKFWDFIFIDWEK